MSDAVPARATHASHRARILGLGLSVGIAIAGCSDSHLDQEITSFEYMGLFNAALGDEAREREIARLLVGDGQITERELAHFDDFVRRQEVVREERTKEFYKALIRAASGTSGPAQDAQRLDPKGAGPVPKGDAQ